MHQFNRHRAYCEKELAKLWTMIPAERHEEVKMAIQQKGEEDRRAAQRRAAEASLLMAKAMGGGGGME